MLSFQRAATHSAQHLSYQMGNGRRKEQEQGKQAGTNNTNRKFVYRRQNRTHKHGGTNNDNRERGCVGLQLYFLLNEARLTCNGKEEKKNVFVLHSWFTCNVFCLLRKHE